MKKRTLRLIASLFIVACCQALAAQAGSVSQAQSPAAGVHFLGHASFRVFDGTSAIYIDPWFFEGPDRAKKPALRADQITDATLVALTHEHWDHLDKAGLATIMQKTNARIAAPEKVLAILQPLFGDRLIPLNPGQSVIEGRFTITAVPSGSIQGFLVRTPQGATLFFSGDEFSWASGAVEAVKAAGRSVDVAFLAVADSREFPATLESFRRFVTEIKPKLVVPMHEGTFTDYKGADHPAYEPIVAAIGGTYQVLDVGGILPLK